MFFIDRPLTWSIHPRLLWVDNDLSYWPSHPTLLSSWNANMSWISKVSLYFVFFLCSKCSQKILELMCRHHYVCSPFQGETSPRSAMCVRPEGPEKPRYSYAGDTALKCEASLPYLKIKEIWYNGPCDYSTVFELYHICFPPQIAFLSWRTIGEVLPLSVDHHGISEKYIYRTTSLFDLDWIAPWVTHMDGCQFEGAFFQPEVRVRNKTNEV